MYRRQIKEINDTIDRTSKAIISLGCSFVQGQGAFTEEIVQQFGTKFTELGDPLRLNDISKNKKIELIKKYPSLELGPNDELNFTFMEYENSFVNVLCKKYFNNEYAAINLGQRGCGNRATIKELYLYPEINWHKLKEIIVVYCPSGPERFDFINDQFKDHGHWICMWPNIDGKTGPKEKLWTGYKESLHSEKFEVLEQIVHVQELLTWCKLHKAKLIITPAFDQRYSKEYFTKSFFTTIERDMDSNRVKQSVLSNIKEMFADTQKSENIVNLFPWENMFYPENMPTFADLALKQEFPEQTKNHNYHFWSFLGKGTPNNWITPCAHPSAKAHDHFAYLLHKHIVDSNVMDNFK